MAIPGLPAASGRLDPFQEHVAVHAEVVVLDGRVGGCRRFTVVAEAVVQHGGRVLHDRDHEALTACGGAVQARAHELQRPRLLPAVGGEHRLDVQRRRRTGYLGDGIGLFEQGSGFVKAPGVHAPAGAVGQRDRQQPQHALCPQNPHLPGRQVVPRLLAGRAQSG
ncbi:hypothetical protein [Amycolatopsis sp. FDAARGOS 1241]|uniref:hypothetical protein n=1 Tax=Amycolatopsis sp. FDAARGOS 1241 TaxID=2778070 RepID=UPI00194E9059|nr:hypothetical protein [Amycolatopsis sp. FDAARGOS 1241]QRP48614.1 hypothetical protein I6J71_12690 [Amycolatopsis sp. FDAARGOS 1241]